MIRTPTRSAHLFLLGAALLVASATVATAAGTARAKRAAAKPTVRATRTTTAAAGMRAYRDPVTGTFTAPPKGIADDGLPVTDEIPDLPQVRLADGSSMIDLQGYGQDYAILTIDAQGRRVMTCTPHPRAALKKLQIPSAPNARPEK